MANAVHFRHTSVAPMKKFINRPEDVVEEMLDGLLLLNPGASRLAGHKVIVRADAEQLREQQVAIISGGGAATNLPTQATSAQGC